jgi:hypothetical protein
MWRIQKVKVDGGEFSASACGLCAGAVMQSRAFCGVFFARRTACLAAAEKLHADIILATHPSTSATAGTPTDGSAINTRLHGTTCNSATTRKQSLIRKRPHDH